MDIYSLFSNFIVFSYGIYKEKTNSKQNKCKDFADWIFLVVFVESGLSLAASMTGTVKISNHIYDLLDIYSPIPVILGIMTFIWFSEQSGQIITNKVMGGYKKLQNILFRYICFTKIPISDM